MGSDQLNLSSNRRFFLRTATASAAFAFCDIGLSSAEPSPHADKNTVRDHLWIWTHAAGVHNRDWNLPRPSRMTPLEGACYLDVPNMLMVRYLGEPPLEQMDQYAVAFRPMKRVAWSLVGASGQTGKEDRELVFSLAERFPNIVGFIMDDFFREDGAGALSPDELKSLRERLIIGGKKHDLFVVVYQSQLGLDLKRHLEYCDVITFWTWVSQEVKDLEKNMDRLDTIAPKHRKLLGCYMWDYGNKRPMPLDIMKRQCELGLQWLKEKRIDGMIFLGSNICDLGLETVEYTRSWIREIGGQRL
ncbi:MAG: hypothetical protein WCU00_11730 [Candidatus Latescibacterota bacterium]